MKLKLRSLTYLRNDIFKKLIISESNDELNILNIIYINVVIIWIYVKVKFNGSMGERVDPLDL